MHPILARGGRLSLYLALWALVGGLLAALLVAQAGLDALSSLLVALPLAVVYAFVCLSAWYVARGLPLASTGLVRVVATAATASILSSAGWLVASRLWGDVLVGRGWIPDVRGARPDTLVFGFGVLLYLLSLAVSYLLTVVEQARESDRRRLQVQVLAREAELRSLRSQIDPHFLFNCLHSISSLTGSDPPAARRMCLLLAEFMRETLTLGGESRITLGRELKLAARFLEIERVRFGARLDVEVSAGDAVESCLVPPLLLQPVVENAVTHGVAHVLEGGTVRVAAARSGSTVSIVVENPCDPDRPRRTGTGVGLANVRARLSALHGSAARVSVQEGSGQWRVELTFPATVGTA